ncbi:MAG: alpha/beta hydrolase [Pseudomonadota bacterium]|jgi:dienelactone hydrolase
MNKLLFGLRPVVALLCIATLPACTSNGLLRLASSADLVNGAVRVDHDVVYGPLPRQRLDLYGPAIAAAQPRPVVVFVHGGSWNSGSKDLYRFVGSALAEQGVVVAVINYRLYPEAHLPESLDDVADAVACAEREAVRFGGDSHHVVLMGHSAGAELAALIALDPQRMSKRAAQPVRGFVGLAGPYDFLPLKEEYLKDYFGPPALYAASQPVNFVSAASAPALLVQGLADTTVAPRNATALAERLRAAGVPVETLLLDQDDHSTVLRRLARPYRHGDAMLDRVAQFVRTLP